MKPSPLNKTPLFSNLSKLQQNSDRSSSQKNDDANRPPIQNQTRPNPTEKPSQPKTQPTLNDPNENKDLKSIETNDSDIGRVESPADLKGNIWDESAAHDSENSAASNQNSKDQVCQPDEGNEAKEVDVVNDLETSAIPESQMPFDLQAILNQLQLQNIDLTLSQDPNDDQNVLLNQILQYFNPQDNPGIFQQASELPVPEKDESGAVEETEDQSKAEQQQEVQPQEEAGNLETGLNNDNLEGDKLVQQVDSDQNALLSSFNLDILSDPAFIASLLNSNPDAQDQSQVNLADPEFLNNLLNTYAQALNSTNPNEQSNLNESSLLQSQQLPNSEDHSAAYSNETVNQVKKNNYIAAHRPYTPYKYSGNINAQSRPNDRQQFVHQGRPGNNFGNQNARGNHKPMFRQQSPQKKSMHKFGNNLQKGPPRENNNQWDRSAQHSRAYNSTYDRQDKARTSTIDENIKRKPFRKPHQDHQGYQTHQVERDSNGLQRQTPRSIFNSGLHNPSRSYADSEKLLKVPLNEQNNRIHYQPRHNETRETGRMQTNRPNPKLKDLNSMRGDSNAISSSLKRYEDDNGEDMLSEEDSLIKKLKMDQIITEQAYSSMHLSLQSCYENLKKAKSAFFSLQPNFDYEHPEKYIDTNGTLKTTLYKEFNQEDESDNDQGNGEIEAEVEAEGEEGYGE